MRTTTQHTSERKFARFGIGEGISTPGKYFVIDTDQGSFYVHGTGLGSSLDGSDEKTIRLILSAPKLAEQISYYESVDSMAVPHAPFMPEESETAAERDRLKEENEKLKEDLKNLGRKAREIDRDRIAYIKSGAKLQALNKELVEVLREIDIDLNSGQIETARKRIKSLLQKA